MLTLKFKLISLFLAETRRQRATTFSYALTTPNLMNPRKKDNQHQRPVTVPSVDSPSLYTVKGTGSPDDNPTAASCSNY